MFPCLQPEGGVRKGLCDPMYKDQEWRGVVPQRKMSLLLEIGKIDTGQAKPTSVYQKYSGAFGYR